MGEGVTSRNISETKPAASTKAHSSIGDDLQKQAPWSSLDNLQAAGQMGTSPLFSSPHFLYNVGVRGALCTG